MSQALLN